MASVNKVTIIGNLGRDPENRYLPSGEQVTSITVATTENWTDKQSGEKKSLTEWHRISFFGKLAEIAGQYLKKGSQVYVEGRIRTRKYTDRDGIERHATEIIGDTIQMLGSKQGGSSQPAGTKQTAQRNSYSEAKQTGQRPAQPANDPDDDIPF